MSNLTDFNGANVLVAGGAGFIGSHLVDRFAQCGANVLVWDNLSTGKRRWLPDVSNVEFQYCDIAQTLPGKPSVDFVFHVASPAAPADYVDRPKDTLAANGRGTTQLVSLAGAKDARFIYASSSEVYGDVKPPSDGSPGALKNNRPLRMPPAQSARSVYPVAKMFGEQIVRRHARNTDLHASVLRLFNIYGPRMDVGRDEQRVIPSFFDALENGRPLPVHGSGKQTRSFCWIDDAVEAIVGLAVHGAGTGEIYNVGNPEMVSINERANRVRDKFGPVEVAHGSAVPHEPEWRRPDITAVQEVSNWEPTVALDEGLERYADRRSNTEPFEEGTTVVVPTYGRPNSLRRLCASLTELDPPPSAVVLVDDATPGGPPPWVERWTRDRERFAAKLCIQDENQGPAAARNHGVQQCQTEYVAFTDDDCELTPHWLAALEKTLDTTDPPIAGVGGSVRAKDSDLFSRYYESMGILEPPDDHSYLVTANAAFRTDLIHGIGGFDEQLTDPGGEDPGLCFALADEGFSFRYNPDATVIHDFRSSLSDFARTFFNYGKGCAHVLRDKL